VEVITEADPITEDIDVDFDKVEASAQIFPRKYLLHTHQVQIV
jgi:hypothetical protein